MCTSLDCAQTNTSSMHRIVINTRLLITGDWTTRTKKRQCFNHSSHFSGVVGVYSGTRESKMSLGGNDGTKHDINSPVRGSGNHTLPARVSPSITRAPPSRVKERSLGRYGYLDLGLGKPEGLVRDAREVLRKTRCLIRVGVGRSDGRH